MSNLSAVIKKMYNKTIKDCSDEEVYMGLLRLTKDALKNKGYNEGKKRVYYISSEFLIGKLLSNNLINLGIYDEIKKELSDNGKDITSIENIENEPSLGNGGLGRLAACFVDSMATLGINGVGITLNYHMGLFKQVFEDNKQKEVPDTWITKESWLNKTDRSYQVDYKGFSLKSKMYSIDVSGYNNKSTKLLLFDSETVDESIVKEGIDFDPAYVFENLTLFIYPDDSTRQGRILRIYQQYFMVSNAAQLILDEAKERGCTDYRDLPEYAVIQINDTHPSMIIPEMIRLLNERGVDMDTAVEIVSKMCAYTNHTILAEALEKWSMDYFEDTLPHLIPIIEMLDKKVKDKYGEKSPLRIIDDKNVVHMAHMDIHYSYSVNGVAKLHTDILKESELNDFYKAYPKKFNNKTNGITFRRWLMYCNSELSDYITELIGDKFKTDANELEKLLKYTDDEEVLKRIIEIKQNNKKRLKAFLKDNTGYEVDENSIFDIQVKRLHEYKRQQMNLLYVINKYLEIKEGNIPKRPLTFIFGAKAAPAYIIAQDIIHAILCMQQIVNNDEDVNKYMKVIMVENYNVTAGEKLFPACDISEQISLASKEASGTGNMKFMLNGAVTLGTLDGANVEIKQLVGDDNIYVFGKTSQEIIEHYEKQDYVAMDYLLGDLQISRLVTFLMSPQMLSVGDYDCLARLHKEILVKDWFMTLIDLKEYIQVKDRAFNEYEDRMSWAKKMLINTAKAGFFSSDRTIKQYNDDIWHI